MTLLHEWQLQEDFCALKLVVILCTATHMWDVRVDNSRPKENIDKYHYKKLQYVVILFWNWMLWRNVYRKATKKSMLQLMKHTTMFYKLKSYNSVFLFNKSFKQTCSKRLMKTLTLSILSSLLSALKMRLTNIAWWVVVDKRASNSFLYRAQ